MESKDNGSLRIFTRISACLRLIIAGLGFEDWGTLFPGFRGQQLPIPRAVSLQSPRGRYVLLRTATARWDTHGMGDGRVTLAKRDWSAVFESQPSRCRAAMGAQVTRAFHFWTRPVLRISLQIFCAQALHRFVHFGVASLARVVCCAYATFLSSNKMKSMRVITSAVGIFARQMSVSEIQIPYKKPDSVGSPTLRSSPPSTTTNRHLNSQ